MVTSPQNQIKNVLAAVFILGGAVCLVLGFKLSWDTRFLKEAVVVKTEAGPRGAPGYYLTVRFKDRSKSTDCRVNVDKQFWRKMYEGAPLLVMYDPQRPSHERLFRVREKEFILPYHLIFLAAGVFCVLLGTVLIKQLSESK